jgi:hypothetical protein
MKIFTHVPGLAEVFDRWQVQLTVQARLLRSRTEKKAHAV